MKSIKNLLDDKGSVDDMANRHKYVTKEFQDYGYRIALKLGEEKRASLYIKLAKEKPRALMDQAFSFAIDYPNAKSKGRLFMWKLKELEQEAKEAQEKRELGLDDEGSDQENNDKDVEEEETGENMTESKSIDKKAKDNKNKE